MLQTFDAIILGVMIFSFILLLVLLRYILHRKGKKQLDKVFVIIFLLLIFWLLCEIIQMLCVNLLNADPIYFDYFSYISVSYLPVMVLLMSIIFARTKIDFKKRYLLLFAIPTISLILLWTNNYHHLFYETYSKDVTVAVFGKYYSVHYYYTWILYGISLFILIKYSIKNSGFFSKQAILIFIGVLIPIVTSILMFTGAVSISPYITPISFALTIIFISFAMLKFSLFKITPIALQRIVDRMSDSYLVLDDDNIITDFNETFLKTFQIKDINLRDKSIFDLLKSVPSVSINTNALKKALDEVKKSNKTVYFQVKFDEFGKYFNIEINSILANNISFIGTLILFKDTTQHNIDMKTIKDNQDKLIEQERLASLGQMIGGIAHNLKTPIMSVAGAVEGLSDLVKEYDASVGDPDVTIEDHHAIANDMRVWLEKIKTHTSYMSDVITAVKGQAVTFSEEQVSSFSIEELFKMVSILMKHELSKAQISLNVQNNVPSNISIHGNINSLIQVINNIVSNSIQASEKATNKIIDLCANANNSNVIISVRDYGIGIPQSVQKTLFKEMVTTKGKNGTGLGLFMSYSNIKAHFNGEITFESDEGVGTVFNIILPA